MDPYAVLGVSRDASRDEIKKAYRREAMKWHPDRSDGSPEAAARFHQAAEAYRILTDRNGPHGNGDTRAGNAGDRAAGSAREGAGADERFADSVFWDVMLDFAIKMAQSGLSENEIAVAVRANGCPDRLSGVIAEKAFHINAHYNDRPDQRKGANPRSNFKQQPTFKQEQLDEELFRAVIGDRSLVWSPRDTIEYYLDNFAEFSRAASFNLFAWIRPHKRLLRIVSFSMLLFAVLVLAINFFPGENEYKLLSDIELLRLPLFVLALTFIWTIFRKLWLLTGVLLLLYLGVFVFFNANMPQVMHRDLGDAFIIGAICYAPFLLAALFANFLYYVKARLMIGIANTRFEDQVDKIVWIKNRAGTSSIAAFAFIVVLTATLTYLAPWRDDVLSSVEINLPGIEFNVDETEQKVRQQLEDATSYFDMAESYYYRSPPNYISAELAYINAADSGSLLAAYKLGYMYYAGDGVERNDILAFDYFQKATRAPLAFQPHSLQLVTQYLAESYNNLGIMYQGGYGVRRNLKKAREMYRKAVEYGSANAHNNLGGTSGSSTGAIRKTLAVPDYR